MGGEDKKDTNADRTGSQVVLAGGADVVGEVNIPEGYHIDENRNLVRTKPKRVACAAFIEAGRRKTNKGRKKRWTKGLQQIFIESVANGASQSRAIRDVGFSVPYITHLKATDPQFVEQLETALAEQGQRLEEEARRRSMGITEELVYKGQPTGHTKMVYSDTLLQTMLKGALPEKYGNNANVNLSGSIDSKVEVTEGAAKGKLLSLLGVSAIELDEDSFTEIPDDQKVIEQEE